MNTAQAFIMGQANRNNPAMVFDWITAARIIRDEKPLRVKAGLSGDWDHTGGTIYAEGAIHTEAYTYLSSTWATPEISVDGDVRPCFVMESEASGWDAHTRWPAEALAILAHGEEVP